MPPPGPKPLSSVDEVRDELRRLGYLDHGLDRFVLSATGTASPARASASAALRVGLLGGLLFGAAATLAAAGIDPRLRSEPQDLVVLAVYLIAASGVLVAAAVFAAGLFTAWLSPRTARAPRPTLSRDVGLVLAALGLVYLALWWPSHAGRMGTALRVVSLVVGIALCAALGRFASLAAVAVLAAGGAGGRLPAASLSRHHMLPLVALLALVLGGAVGASALLRAEEPSEGPDFAVIPSGIAVRVIAIDGLERRMAEQLMAAGEMPNLAALAAAGARARLTVEPEQVPAIVWTTIATGRGPEAHGIHSVGGRRLPGMRTPVPLAGDSAFTRALGAATDLLRLTHTQPAGSVLREAKTFWNVASEKGLRVAVVNWWATWPADVVNGFVVTDRALLRLEKGGTPDRDTHPGDLIRRLRPLAEATEAERPRRIDRFAVESALLIRSTAPVDLLAVYLPGLDIATMQKLGDERAVADVAGTSARLDAVRAHHRFVDELIGRAAAGASPTTAIVVVGDPGRLPRRAGEAEGVLILTGPVVPGSDLGAARERDVAPTVLHLLGLPVSAQLEGQVLESALHPDFRAAHPVRHVAAYGRRRSAPAAGSAFDKDMLEELRSLGYIQ